MHSLSHCPTGLRGWLSRSRRSNLSFETASTVVRARYIPTRRERCVSLRVVSTWRSHRRNHVFADLFPRVASSKRATGGRQLRRLQTLLERGRYHLRHRTDSSYLKRPVRSHRHVPQRYKCACCLGDGDCNSSRWPTASDKPPDRV